MRFKLLIFRATPRWGHVRALMIFCARGLEIPRHIDRSLIVFGRLRSTGRILRVERFSDAGRKAASPGLSEGPQSSILVHRSSYSLAGLAHHERYHRYVEGAAVPEFDDVGD